MALRPSHTVLDCVYTCSMSSKARLLDVSQSTKDIKVGPDNSAHTNQCTEEANSKMTHNKRIAIIGAGCSGLTAIKSCLDAGMMPICFERDDDIGGLWNYSESPNENKGSVYDSCVINTTKEMMAFSDFPVPKDFPPFMHHRKVMQYFRMYAKRFRLLSHIRFNTSVENVQPAHDYQETGKWCIYYRHLEGEDGEESDVSCETFDGVMVCSGHHTNSHVPVFEGAEDFQGETLHSHDYKRPDVFRGKRVLVVGK